MKGVHWTSNSISIASGELPHGNACAMGFAHCEVAQDLQAVGIEFVDFVAVLFCCVDTSSVGAQSDGEGLRKRWCAMGDCAEIWGERIDDDAGYLLRIWGGNAGELAPRIDIEIGCEETNILDDVHDHAARAVDDEYTGLSGEAR